MVCGRKAFGVPLQVSCACKPCLGIEDCCARSQRSKAGASQGQKEMVDSQDTDQGAHRDIPARMRIRKKEYTRRGCMRPARMRGRRKKAPACAQGARTHRTSISSQSTFKHIEYVEQQA